MGVQLPVELWLQIGGHLPRADINRLVRSNHTFHSLLLPLLHRDLRLSSPLEGASDRAERIQAIHDRLERIGAKSELAFAVRSCGLYFLGGTLLEEAITFLGTLPNLSSLLLHKVFIEADQLIRLSKSWRSPIELTFSDAKVRPADLPPSTIKETPPNLSSLTLTTSIVLPHTPWRLFVQWTFSVNLETLVFEDHHQHDLVLDALFEAHINALPKASFPRLKTLHLSRLPAREISGGIFDCMPMLENLHIASTANTSFHRPLTISETAIPKLRRYEGSAINALSLIPRRPIDHLNLIGEGDLPTLWGSQTSPILNFGSTSAIRYLDLPPIADPLPTLQFIALICPSLYELRLNRPDTSYIFAVSLQSLGFPCLTGIN
jgi:hypothetical protein